MQGKLIVVYKNHSELDLTTLGESLIGLQDSLDELVGMSRLNGEVQIKAERINEGSIEVHVGLYVIAQIPFKEITDLYNFLFVTNSELHKEALGFFQEITTAHRGINDFVAAHPADVWLGAGLVKFIVDMLGVVPDQKNGPNELGGRIPQPYAVALHKAVETKVFKGFLKPIVEGQVEEILVAGEDFSVSHSIDEDSVGEYLPENEEILPELENGKILPFTGQIRDLKSNRGESISLRLNELQHLYKSVESFPPDGMATEDFLPFYKTDANLQLEVFRKSMYQKPKFILRHIEKQQESLLY